MQKVLVVDDAAFMRNQIKAVLKKHNYNVIGEANNGLKGFIEYKKLHPDIVFLDINMPIINGIDTLRMILEYDKEAYVVICSAMGQEPYINEARKLGAKDYIIKPFTEERIIDVLTSTNKNYNPKGHKKSY